MKPNLFGSGAPVSEEQVLRGMRTLEERLRTEADRLYERYTDERDKELFTAALAGRKREPIELAREHAYLRAARYHHGRSLGQRPKPSNVEALSPFVSETMPYSAYRVPPYDYHWTWEYKKISGLEGPVVTTHAGKDTGSTEFYVDSFIARHETQCYVAAAVGIYFRPTAPGPALLHISALPNLTVYAGAYTSYSTVLSLGWMGFWVGAYRVSDDSFKGAVVDQAYRLWYLDPWNDVEFYEVEKLDHPLAATFRVDPEHYYSIWVSCGGYEHAQGIHFWYTSQAYGYLEALIPFIHWTYIP